MNSSTILVVDDEPQLRRVIRTTLNDLGYLVIEAKSGEEAIETLRRESPDLILLDLNMPGMGGLEACRAIRASSDIPIIILASSGKFVGESGDKGSLDLSGTLTGVAFEWPGASAGALFFS